MKKTVSVIISLILTISAILPFATVGATSTAQDWYTPAADGAILYTPNFNGDPGVYEPAAFSGTPLATVDPYNNNTITIQTTTDKKASYWGGFIDTLPLNENTCYTIYYTVTRTGSHSAGVYFDSVYGVYGYPERTKLMNKGSSLSGHDYQLYSSLGLEVPVLANDSVVQELALEVNGTNTKFANYIKNNLGEYVLLDESEAGAITFFNADNLGVFFYSYYANHLVTFSDFYIVKGLDFGEVTVPETTEAPDDTTKAPDDTTKAPDDTTKAPDDTTKTPDDTTVAPGGDNTTEAPKDEGCASTITCGITLALAVCYVPVLIRKKRR